MELLCLVYFILISKNVVKSELLPPLEITNGIFHFTFTAHDGSEATARVMEDLLKKSSNSVPSVVTKFPIKYHRLIDLQSSSYKGGPIFYFIQADFGTPVDSITNLLNFYHIVPKNNRDNFHIWISPDGIPIGEYRGNQLQENISTVRSMMLDLFGCLFQVLVPRSIGGRIRIEPFSIPTGEFVSAEKIDNR